MRTRKLIPFLSILLLIAGCDQEEPPVPPTLEVSASPDSIPYSGSSVISWKSDHSDYVLVNNQKMGTEDSLVVEGLTTSTTYTITAVGSNNKSVVKDVMITVGKADAPTVEISSPSGPIPYGTSTSFSWVAGSLVTSVVLDGLFVADSSSYTTPVLYESKEYTLVVEGPGGFLVKKVMINVDKAIAPTVTVISSPEIIPYGTSTSFSWSTKGLVTSVTLNGVVMNDSTFKTPALYESKEYTLAVKGPGGTVFEKVSISVGDWTTSKLGLLTFKPWKLKSLRYLRNGEIIADLLLPEDKKSELFYYRISGKAELFTSSGGFKTSFDWSFQDDENYILEGDQYFLIFSLTKDLLVLQHESSYDGTPAIYEKTYWRP